METSESTNELSPYELEIRQIENNTPGSNGVSAHSIDTDEAVLNDSETDKKRSLKDLTSEELNIYGDGVAAFKDFVEYTQEIKRRNHTYDAVQTAIYICSSHRTVVQKFSHVIEIMCHEGQFDPKIFFDYIIMMRNNETKEKAIKDAMYDMLYIIKINKNLNAKKRREVFHRFVENYREQDRRKKEQVDEATERAKEIKDKNKKIYKDIIIKHLEAIKKQKEENV